MPAFQWINTVLGNLKTSLGGSDHGFALQKYAARYLGAFAYRFNRRFDPGALLLLDRHDQPEKAVRRIMFFHPCDGCSLAKFYCKGVSWHG